MLVHLQSLQFFRKIVGLSVGLSHKTRIERQLTCGIVKVIEHHSFSMMCPKSFFLQNASFVRRWFALSDTPCASESLRGPCQLLEPNHRCFTIANKQLHFQRQEPPCLLTHRISEDQCMYISGVFGVHHHLWHLKQHLTNYTPSMNPAHLGKLHTIQAQHSLITPTYTYLGPVPT